MPGCPSEALKRLEKWATENQWISKASAKFWFWKRTAPQGITGQDWQPRKQLCREKAEPAESWLAISGICYQPVPPHQGQPTVLGCASNTVEQGRQKKWFLTFMFLSTYRVSFPILGSSVQEGYCQVGTSPGLGRMCFVNPKWRQQRGDRIAVFNYLTAG